MTDIMNKLSDRQEDSIYYMASSAQDKLQTLRRERIYGLAPSLSAVGMWNELILVLYSVHSPRLFCHLRLG